MAKKKEESWLPPDNITKTAAKKSIQKTNKVKIERTVKAAKKKGRGRPKATDGEQQRISITEEAHKWTKVMAAMNQETIIEYVSSLILKDAKEKGFIK